MSVGAYSGEFPFGYYNFGVDGISLVFIILTGFVFPLCFLSSWNLIYNSEFKDLKLYIVCFLLLQICVTVVFATLNLLFFFIFFEAILIPMSLIISV